MKYLILGASAAGLNAAKTLRKLDPASIITIVSQDSLLYSKSLLHLFVTGERSLRHMNFVEDNFFKKYDINWVKGVSATGVNTYRQEVNLSNNLIESYDKLLIATGSSTKFPPNLEYLDGMKNVYTLGTITDAIKIKDNVGRSKTISFIGGGTVCFNLVSKLINRGYNINIIEYGNNVMAAQLNKEAAKPYEEKFIKSGGRLYTNSIVVEAETEDDRITSLTLLNGDKIPTDMVIVTAGTSPNVDFLKDSGIVINKGLLAIRGEVLRDGVIVDRRCQTNIDNIFAAGDVCAEKLSLWPLAVKQGIVAAYNMALRERAMSTLHGFKNSFTFFGINTISIGDPNLDNPNYREEIYRDEAKGIYKRALLDGGLIKSIILQGDIRGAGVFERLIEYKVDISHVDKYIFDLNFYDFFILDDRGEMVLDLDKVNEKKEELRMKKKFLEMQKTNLNI